MRWFVYLCASSHTKCKDLGANSFFAFPYLKWRSFCGALRLLDKLHTLFSPSLFLLFHIIWCDFLSFQFSNLKNKLKKKIHEMINKDAEHLIEDFWKWEKKRSEFGRQYLIRNPLRINFKHENLVRPLIELLSFPLILAISRSRSGSKI